MIQPGNYDITIQQNSNWDMTFQLKDSTGTAINLTGATIQAEIWTEGKRSKLADFTVTYTNRSTGTFKLTLDDSVTTTLPDSGYYDILVTDSTGASYYWLRGQARLEIGYTE
jgi:hypothetical protein